MEGLVTGLLKFDPARGHKLSSLLVWWIRNSISVLSTAVNNVVHVPRAAQFAARKLRQSRRQLASRLGRCCKPCYRLPPSSHIGVRPPRALFTELGQLHACMKNMLSPAPFAENVSVLHEHRLQIQAFCMHV